MKNSNFFSLAKLFSMLLVCFIFLGSPAFGQQNAPAKKVELVRIAASHNIIASYFMENFATQPAYCLNFENTGKSEISFKFILKDEKGNIISQQSLSLASGQSVNGLMNPIFDKSMIIHLKENQKASDFSIELIF